MCKPYSIYSGTCTLIFDTIINLVKYPYKFSHSPVQFKTPVNKTGKFNSLSHQCVMQQQKYHKHTYRSDFVFFITCIFDNTMIL